MSLFGKLFRSKSQADPGFINPLHVELHSHLIPGIDDGVQAMEESLQVLQAWEQMGYTKAITTPHIMGDFYKNGPHNILPKLDEMRQAMKEREMKIELHAAAEYLVDDALEMKIEKKELLTFGNNYVLIELPFTEEPANLKSILFSLRVNGYRPVLAHPERYGFLGNRKEKYEELFESGILFQVNIFSLIGYYSPQVQKAAEFLIERKMVNMVGSDTHGVRHLPVLQAALNSYNYQKICELPLLNNTL
jgi:tyrosine-protein phosphatase YwqE